MRTRGKITSASVAALKAGQTLWDGELQRFGARRQNRAVSYIVKVRVNREQRLITIGRHGPLTAAEAREKARRLLAEIDEQRYARL